MKKRQKSKSFDPKKGVRWLVGLGLVVLIYFLFFHGPRSVIQYLKQTSYKKSLEQEIQSLENDKKRLKSEADRLKNDLDYIEKIAREKYNMKKKDEKVYKIIKEK